MRLSKSKRNTGRGVGWWRHAKRSELQTCYAAGGRRLFLPTPTLHAPASRSDSGSGCKRGARAKQRSQKPRARHTTGRFKQVLLATLPASLRPHCAESLLIPTARVRGQAELHKKHLARGSCYAHRLSPGRNTVKTSPRIQDAARRRDWDGAAHSWRQPQKTSGPVARVTLIGCRPDVIQ